jgi:PST family polysaccharide transporter/lipopolysaccharide exporter
MSIALLAVGALNRFSRLGLDRALVQREEANVDAYLDTAFALQFARGVVLAAVLFLAAPAIAAFFGDPQVTPLLRAVALSPLIQALFNPAILYFEKDLDLHRRFALDASGAATEFVVAVSLALATGSVWALVVGFLAADCARLVASYALHGYRPGTDVGRERARELVDYGKWITGSSAISFLLTSGDDAVVGRLLTTTALGYYRLGYQLGKTPTMELSRALSTVTFPMYSKLQADDDALADALRRVVRLLSFASFPAAVGVVLVAPSFVRVALGSEWTAVVPVMQAVAVYGAFSALTSSFNDVWNAIGRPDLNTKINALRLVVTGALVVPATLRYELLGTVAVMAGVFLVLVVPVKFHVAARTVGVARRDLLVELAYPALASAAMGAVLLGVRRLATPSPLVELVALVVLGVAVYAGAVYAIAARSSWGIDGELRTVLAAVRG